MKRLKIDFWKFQNKGATSVELPMVYGAFLFPPGMYLGREVQRTSHIDCYIAVFSFFRETEEKRRHVLIRGLSLE